MGGDINNSEDINNGGDINNGEEINNKHDNEVGINNQSKHGEHLKFETSSESSISSSGSKIRDNDKLGDSLVINEKLGMPPVPEIKSIPANHTELKALLSAWYTAGYYAAKYEMANK